MSFGVEAQFRENEEKHWSVVFQELGEISPDLSFKKAKLPENKGRNRYRKVYPFDHSRVCLQSGTNDYINASLVIMKEARRKYILTQGPLPSTCGHFWQMVWEQKSEGVVMLNRIIELGSVKCTQYWPPQEIGELVFKDTGFRLTLLSEDERSNCIVRHMELENMATRESRHVVHFQYTAWPDFGTPETPTSFLSFILFIRASGCLSEDRGPTVVQCSSGMGRSGVFCLVDTCLLLIALRRDPLAVCVRDVLLEMRRFRMDLVQTPQQLRFAYLAIIEGTRPVLRTLTLMEPRDTSEEEEEREGEEEDTAFVLTQTLPLCRPLRHAGSEEAFFFSGTEDEDNAAHAASCSTVCVRSQCAFAPGETAPVCQSRSASPRGLLGLELRSAADLATLGTPTPSQGPRGGRRAGPVSSVLAGAYLCAALALGAYICYRASLH